MRTVTELLEDPVHGLVREARPAQLTMALSIDAILQMGGVYFCEAPVATGKTYAYLVPALLAKGLRVVVATAKKQLQDQIVDKDYPALKKVLGTDVPPGIAVPLKGKGNYACRVAATSLVSQNALEATTYARFLETSNYGDRADYEGTPPRWWGAATAEGCVGPRCRAYNDCGYIRLKRDAAQSNLVVINHHLLGSDMYFGLGKLVGGPYDVLIIDEAHTLDEGIRAAFTHRVGEDALHRLSDMLSNSSHPFPAIRKALPLWEALFTETPNRGVQESKTCATPVFDVTLATAAISALQQINRELNHVIKLYSGDNSDDRDTNEAPNTESCGIDDGLEMFNEPIEAIECITDATLPVEKVNDLALFMQASRQVDVLLKGMQAAQGLVEPDLTITDPVAQALRHSNILKNTAVYTTVDDRGRYSVDCAPIHVGGIAGRYLSALKAVVVCSATLAVNNNFDRVKHMTGLTPIKTDVLPTSFNYAAQGFVYIPRDLPSVGRTDANYVTLMAQRVDLAVQLVTLSDGGAFILTTANDELDAYAAALKKKYPRRTFVQGHKKNPWDGDAQAVLRAFRATKDALLVGSKSFWEGVDVPGSALRLVIISKLPFPQYNDPIVQARERLAGASAFNDVSLADMLVVLRQGVGRLIRSQDDRGCVAILDSRIWDKSYGGAVRCALPWPHALVTSKLSACETYLPKYAAYFKSRPHL
jgi:ATP-dependent DNA helicase DinG